MFASAVRRFVQGCVRVYERVCEGGLKGLTGQG